MHFMHNLILDFSQVQLNIHRFEDEYKSSEYVGPCSSLLKIYTMHLQYF